MFWRLGYVPVISEEPFWSVMSTTTSFLKKLFSEFDRRTISALTSPCFFTALLPVDCMKLVPSLS